MGVYVPKRHPEDTDNSIDNVIRLDNTDPPIIYFRGPMRGGPGHLYALPANVRKNDVLIQYESTTNGYAPLDDDISIDSMPLRVYVHGEGLSWHDGFFSISADDIKDVKSVLEWGKEGQHIVDKYRLGIKNRFDWNVEANLIEDRKKRDINQMNMSHYKKIRQLTEVFAAEMEAKRSMYDVIAPDTGLILYNQIRIE
jgi:hypothetical protein